MVINVYSPYDNFSITVVSDGFLDCINCIEDILVLANCDSYILCGDFNSSFQRANEQRNCLQQFVVRDIHMSSWEHVVAEQNFTYVNHSLGHRSSIDHFFTVDNGIKQGGIISPILFNMYMDDLSITLNNSGIGGYLGDAFLNHLCYADDIHVCLISLSSSGMKQLLNICQNYATNHQLLYNGAKSFSLCLKNNDIKIKQSSFYLAHLRIPIVENCKYLGIITSTKNSDLDLKRQMRKIYANANILFRKFSCCSVSVKCYLFNTYCSTL